MMDWPRFFTRHRIEFASGGSNVSKGNIATHCPFCGRADQGQHMSISLHGRGWRCFRQPQHRGKNPTRLIQALLGCTMDEAVRMVEDDTFIPEDFLGHVNRLMAPPAVPAPPEPLQLLDSFKPFRKINPPSARPFEQYLRKRYINDAMIMQLTTRWGMYYARRGVFAYRVIFTVRHEGKLISWTGRAINPDAEIRYRTLSANAEACERLSLKPAIGSISHYLLWYDTLMRAPNPETIVLCEGPMDALKINLFGSRMGIWATCFFTSSPTDRQVQLLHTLLPRFRRHMLCLDQGMTANAMRVHGQLWGRFDIAPMQLPPGVKDPGEIRDKASFLRIFSLD